MTVGVVDSLITNIAQMTRTLAHRPKIKATWSEKNTIRGLARKILEQFDSVPLEPCLDKLRRLVERRDLLIGSLTPAVAQRAFNRTYGCSRLFGCSGSEDRVGKTEQSMQDVLYRLRQLIHTQEGYAALAARSDPAAGVGPRQLEAAGVGPRQLEGAGVGPRQLEAAGVGLPGVDPALYIRINTDRGIRRSATVAKPKPSNPKTRTIHVAPHVKDQTGPLPTVTEEQNGDESSSDIEA